MRKKKQWPPWLIILAIIIVIAIAYVVYTLTLGQIDLTRDSKRGETPEEKKFRAATRHKKLQELIAKKEGLKKKLEKRFRYAYLSLRILFVLLVIGFNALLFYGFKIQTLGNLLNWNQLLAIGWIGINFVCYGTITNLKAIIKYFKNRVENWVYGRYVTLNKQIETHKLEAENIMKES